ncbi:nucleoside hydrolase [Micromonospora sp. NBC_01655]|uniref:nucleoside hydrolase n=1 Tax=Micromonospora sp. NBC_01655 TaxID=2975983 RepID=UPI002253637E|nr:nucleoside hydrolase [Micromonospora sp. NBC_01655]MCX4472515.1 nucleoside hydrolase [Micromonospora sp. NBC_01655]
MPDQVPPRPGHGAAVAGTRRRIVVDTDGGVDDLVALAWLLGLPEVDVPAVIATGGARTVDVVGAAVTHVLKTLAPVRRPLLLRGAEVTPARRTSVPSGVHLHGEYGLGTLVPPCGPEFGGGVDDEALPPHTDYLVLGPCTTAARIASQGGHRPGEAWLTVMGGAFSLPGVVQGAEPNFARDPHAARLLLTNPPGKGVRIVPTDVTTQARCPDTAVRYALAGGEGWLRLRAQLLAYYWSAGSARYCHDLVAAAVAVCPGMVTAEVAVAVTVDENGRSSMTAAAGSAVRVVHGLHEARWRAVARGWASNREMAAC